MRRDMGHGRRVGRTSSCCLVGLIKQWKIYSAAFLGWRPLTAPKHTNPTKCQQQRWLEKIIGMASQALRVGCNFMHWTWGGVAATFAIDCSRALSKEFYVNQLRNKLISTRIGLILFFDLLPTRLHRDWSDRAPLTSLSGCSSFPTRPPSPPRVFNWLLCVACRQCPQRPQPDLFSYFLSPHSPPSTT